MEPATDSKILSEIWIAGYITFEEVEWMSHTETNFTDKTQAQQSQLKL